jgi:hypothetical protein
VHLHTKLHRTCMLHHSQSAVNCLCALCCSLQAGADAIGSCLAESRRGMRQALLGVIGLGMITCEQDIQEYVNCR